MSSLKKIPDMEFNALLNKLGTYSHFRDNKDWVETKNVWARPLRPQTFKYVKFDRTNNDNKFNYAALTLNRILTALNEQDFLFLPEKSDNIVNELKVSYTEELRVLAAKLIPELEDRTLGFLRSEIQVSEHWTRKDFENYFEEKIKQNTKSRPESFDIIENSDQNEMLAKALLIQHAVDFLPESSHMVRFAKGDYGEPQSALFRVLLDEYGYGKHSTKHSTLFKKTLASVGMETNSHAYWAFYLNSTLLANNYFHSLTRSPERFFEYIGAIAYAENSFGPYCLYTKELLHSVFGENVDTRYYTEHVHIDMHHGRMTTDDLLYPLIKKYGENVIPEIVRGVETASKLGEIAEEDFKAQMDWMNKQFQHRELAESIKQNVLADIEKIPVAPLDEPFNELSVTHVHDGDEFCIVDEGVLRFCHGPHCFSDLQPGECVVIRKNRLHGALVISDNCKYRILSIDDYRKYTDTRL